MGSCTFNKCCCCIELKTGCLILGYLSLVITLIFTAMTLLGVLAINVATVTNESTDKAKQEQMEAAAYLINIVAIVFLPFLILGLAMTIVLLVGLHKNKPGHVKAYLIYNVIFLVVFIIQFIVKMVNAATVQGAISDLISIGLSVYFLLVIKSYYHKMRETNNGPAIYKA